MHMAVIKEEYPAHQRRCMANGPGREYRDLIGAGLGLLSDRRETRNEGDCDHEWAMGTCVHMRGTVRICWGVVSRRLHIAEDQMQRNSSQMSSQTGRSQDSASSEGAFLSIRNSGLSTISALKGVWIALTEFEATASQSKTGFSGTCSGSGPDGINQTLGVAGQLRVSEPS